MLSLPAPRFRFAPRFQDEIVSLKKRPFLAGFLTFFGAVFLHVTHIYMHDMDILRKSRPQPAFPSRSEASNILV